MEARKKDADSNKEQEDLEEFDERTLPKNLSSIITYLEGSFECSGLCRPTFFYYSLPLTKGRPTRPCLSFLNETVGEEMIYLGIMF